MRSNLSLFLFVVISLLLNGCSRESLTVLAFSAECQADKETFGPYSSPASCQQLKRAVAERDAKEKEEEKYKKLDKEIAELKAKEKAVWLSKEKVAEREKVFQRLQPLAQKGDAESQYQLGLFYNDLVNYGKTEGYAASLADAAKKKQVWCERSAKQGNSKAMWALAFTYRENRERFVYWLEQAAIHGHSDAAEYLGNRLMSDAWNSKTRSLDSSVREKAYYWFEIAGYLGNEKAMKRLAKDYERGYLQRGDKGLGRFARAIYWYRKAGFFQGGGGEWMLHSLTRSAGGEERVAEIAQEESAKEKKALQRLEVARSKFSAANGLR